MEEPQDNKNYLSSLKSFIKSMKMYYTISEQKKLPVNKGSALIKEYISKYENTIISEYVEFHKELYRSFYKIHKDHIYNILNDDTFLTNNVILWLGQDVEKFKKCNYKILFSSIFKLIKNTHEIEKKKLLKNDDDESNLKIKIGMSYLLYFEVQYHFLNVIKLSLKKEDKKLNKIIAELQELARLTEEKEKKDMSSGLGGSLNSFFGNMMPGISLGDFDSNGIKGYLDNMLAPELSNTISEVMEKAKNENVDVKDFIQTIVPTVNQLNRKNRAEVPDGVEDNSDPQEDLLTPEKVDKLTETCKNFAGSFNDIFNFGGDQKK